MPKESIIRILRSDTASAVPSLTAGEIAVNIPDQRLFVGNSTGGVISFFGNGVTGVNGITGGVSITSGSNITITQSGKTITIASSASSYTAPLATSSITGVASFRAADFDVSTTGSVSLTGTVARTNASQTFTGLQTFSSGISANGLTGTILTPSQPNITSVGTLTSLNTAGLTSTQRVTISSGGLSVAGNIDGTIGTAAQPNITSLGTLTSLNTAGLTSTQRVNVSSGGIVVQAGGLSVTGGANITGGSIFFGDIEVYDGAFIRTGGLSVTGGIAGTIVTPAQTNITSVGTLTSLTVSGLLSTQALNVVAGATFGADIYVPNMVTGVNGITGAVSISQGNNIAVTQSGKTITVGTSLPLASSTVTGVASFNNEFVVSNLGNVGLTSNYVRSWNGLTGAVLFSNFVSSINNITGAFGLTGTQHEIEIIGATSMVVGLPDNVRITQTLTISGGTAWHSLNDGKNSGLDADLVHGVYGTRFTENLQTGLLYGGVLSINTGNTAAFNISAGSGIIVDSNATTGAAPNPTVTTVNWNAATGLTLPGLTSQDITWISINSSGNVIRNNSTFTNSQYENEIVIGALIHPSRTFISFAKNYPHVAYGQASQFDPFIRAFGPLKLSGHELSGSATTLQLNRSSGTSYAIGRNYLTDPDNPNIITDTNATPVSTIYRLRRNTTNGFTTVINSAVDTGNYDDGTGTLAAVPGGQYTIQRVFFYPSEPTVLAVYYGRATYNSIDNAKAAIPYEQFSESTDTAESAIFCGYLIVKSGATNFSNAADYQFIQAGLFRSTSNVGSGGVAVVRLDDLTDVTITSPTDNNYLGYNSTLSQWVNIPFTSLPIVTSFNGATGTVTFAPPLATSSVTGVASFPNTDFSVSSVGAVSLTGNVARTHIGQTFTGLQVFSSGLSANGLTGTILTPAQTNITSLGTLTSLNTAGLTSTQRVTISSGGLSVAGNIDGTIGTAAQSNITSLGSLTTLTTAGLTSTQRVNVSAGGIVVQAGGLSVTGGSNLTGGSTFFGDIEVYDGAFIRTGGLSVTGGIAGTILTPAQTNITSVGVLSGLSVNNGLSVTGGISITGGVNIGGGGISVTGGIAGTIVTPAQTNITSVGTLTSLTTSGLLSAQALNVVAGATFGIDIYAPNMVTGVNGITGAVSITSGSGITITQTGKQITVASSITQYTAPLATSSITGVASFPNADFSVSAVGAVSLTGNVARTHIGQTFTGLQVFSSGLSANGLTGTILTPSQTNITALGTLTSLNTAGITSTQRVTISAGGLSVAGNIDGTIGTAAQPNITSLGTLTSLNTAGMTSTQRVTISSGGLSVAGNIDGTIGTAAQPNITSLGTLTSLNTAGMTSTQRVTISSGGLSVAGNIDGTIGTAAQPNITSLGSLTTLTTAGLTSTQRINVSAGGIVVQAGGLSVTGGSTLTGGSIFFGDIEVYDGAFIRTGGLSVTGGIAGTIVTPAQPNITSLGTLTSLTTSGLLSAQALNVVAGATFGIDIYAPNMVTGVNGITGAVSLTSGSNITITQTGKTITIAAAGGGGGGSSPLATSSVTGVASFPNADFSVSAVGAVSLTGNVARTNISQTFSSVQGFAGGFTAAGATFTSNIFAPNLVSSVNSITGAVSLTSGSNVTITQSGNVITIASSGGGGGGGSDFPGGISSAGATFTAQVNMGSNTLYQPTLRYYNEPTSSPTIVGGGLTFDLSVAQIFTVTANANIGAVSISNTPSTASRAIGFTLILTADGTARGLTWGSAIKWANSDPPARTITNNKKDVFSFMTTDGGTNWLGFIGGLNY